MFSALMQIVSTPLSPEQDNNKKKERKLTEVGVQKAQNLHTLPIRLQAIGSNPLLAIKDNHTTSIQALLDEVKDPQAIQTLLDLIVNSDNTTLLSYLAKHGNKTTIQAFFDKIDPKTLQASLKLRDNQGWSALMVAVKYERSDFIQIVFKKLNKRRRDKIIGLTDHDGNNLLMIAAKYSTNASTTQTLLDNLSPSKLPVILLGQTNKDNQNALTLQKRCDERFYQAACQKLSSYIMAGARAGEKNIISNTLRNTTPSQKNDILTQGNTHGRTALMIAIQAGHQRSVIQILDNLHGPSRIDHQLSQVDSFGRNALMYAAIYSATGFITEDKGTERLNILELIISQLPSPEDKINTVFLMKALDATDNYGQTALMLAARFGNTASLHVVLNTTPSTQLEKAFTETDTMSLNALMLAICRCNFDTVKAILEKMDKLDKISSSEDTSTQKVLSQPDKIGMTALMLAAKHDHTGSIAEAILSRMYPEEQQAALNERNQLGETAAMIATRAGLKDVAYKLNLLNNSNKASGGARLQYLSSPRQTLLWNVNQKINQLAEQFSTDTSVTSNSDKTQGWTLIPSSVGTVKTLKYGKS